MFDGIDAGADRGLDPVGAVGVGGDPQAPLMRFLGDRAKLLLAHLLLAGLGIAGEDPAGGADLDHLGAIFALPPDIGAERLRTVRHAFLRGLEARRKIGRNRNGRRSRRGHSPPARSAGPTA